MSNVRRHVETTPQFDHTLERFIQSHADLRGRTLALIDRLALNPFDPHNKTHRLSGVLKQLWAANVNHKYRLVFELSDTTIWFLNIGSHDDVY